MSNPIRDEIAVAFANALLVIEDGQLLVLMDDFKAMATIAAIHRDRQAAEWLQGRVDAITDEYLRRQEEQQLPF